MSEQNAPTDSFSGVLNSILSDPQMLSTITSMAQRLKEGSDSQPVSETQHEAQAEKPDALASADKESSAPTSLPDAIGALAPLLSGITPKHSKKDDDRACLLRALKPYLSQDRSQAIDYIIRFSSIADVLKNLS